ncbi:MAG: hypothetical protein AVDCRST_MAG19-510 [uncultured Thermomicrobiales bacterium]|uniref:Uncharacterized protein n=1 Tax=uncultured Thermomicrobiales bacterium TaxID=1645740 RepID=A0A6J4UEE1_9BACT|nr:MAG: hypothetical protein AVDCRST_MAG19-510 [uncultured Thermomicrobiales bacterium]
MPDAEPRPRSPEAGRQYTREGDELSSKDGGRRVGAAPR